MKELELNHSKMRVRIPMMSFCTLLLLSIIANCLSVPITTANTTSPVLVGPVKKIKAKATAPSEGRDFHFENTSMTKTETAGGTNHGYARSTEYAVDPRFFDVQALKETDTLNEHLEVKQINIGSYSAVQIIFYAFHKIWAGMEGKIVKKENLK